MNHRFNWMIWPGMVALGPLTVAFVYFAHAQGWPLVNRGPNEAAATVLTASAALIFALRTILQRNPLYLLIACFGVIACLREWHPPWMHHGVYYMLLALIVCTWLLRERIRPLAHQGLFLPWLKTTLVLYFFAVLLARRAFKHWLPYEDEVNTQLEETVENVAHLMLLLGGLFLGSWRSQSGLGTAGAAPPDQQPGTNPPAIRAARRHRPAVSAPDGFHPRRPA